MDRHTLITIIVTTAVTAVVTMVVTSIFKAVKDLMAARLIETAKSHSARKLVYAVFWVLLSGVWLVVEVFDKSPLTRFGILRMIFWLFAFMVYLGNLAFQIGRIKARKELAKNRPDFLVKPSNG